ncbi:hypothetical protein JTB14_019672 [Gonioctena quinquepunctata]|nr:hypothetical protein JTB14_019672 [Gonioctena quinquepunctata]
MVFVLFVRFVLKTVKKKKLVFKDIWTLADIIIISLSIACLFFFMERSFMVKIFLDNIEKAKHNEFINYFHLFSAEKSLTAIAAVLIFIATLRLWKLLRFLKIIKIVEKTLRLSILRLFFVFGYQMMLVFAFQLIGTILFEDQKRFRDDQDSFMTLIQLALCFLKTYDFQSVRAPLERSYFSIYLIISLIFLNFHVAVITTCYREAQLYYSNRKTYNVFDYLCEQYQYFKKVLTMKMERFRQRGGQDGSTSADRKIVFAKADEHRYAKCLTIHKNKMNAMLYITIGILRNMKSIRGPRKNYGNIMKIITANITRKDSQEVEYFFVKESTHNRANLVDDLVLKKIELFLTMLLTKKDQKEELEEEKNYDEKFGEIVENLYRVLKFLREANIGLDIYARRERIYFPRNIH